ncbi:15080_t:CDS:2 [Rhizophagus irregularis]|nr:15080_t:CDS:2 [Rhizophagus irregularis]
MELEEPTSNNSNISNDNSDSDEYEEEVSYIIIDLATRTTNHSQKSFHYYIKPLANNEKESVGDEPSNFNNKKENNDIDYSLIGLDTDTPYLRIGNIHFKGEYDETIGTDLIFFPEPDPINPRQQKLTYQCQTTKKIKFSQVNLQEINLDKTSELNQFNIDDDNEWENKYSISKKKFSLDDQELFNIKKIINQEQNIEISNVETRKEEDTMEID